MTTGELRGRCRQPSKDRADQYRGVRWDRKSNAWQASISAGDQRTRVAAASSIDEGRAKGAGVGWLVGSVRGAG